MRRNVKLIWRDNTMPPTNYIWMRTDMNDELIGIYEWRNGRWWKIRAKSGSGDCSNCYSKIETDILLLYTEQEIIKKISTGEYDIDLIPIDEELSLTSTNPVQNRVITEELNKKLDKVEFYDSAIQEPDYPWNN